MAISTVRKGRDEGRVGPKPGDVVNVRLTQLDGNAPLGDVPWMTPLLAH